MNNIILLCITCRKMNVVLILLRLMLTDTMRELAYYRHRISQAILQNTWNISPARLQTKPL